MFLTKNSERDIRQKISELKREGWSKEFVYRNTSYDILPQPGSETKKLSELPGSQNKNKQANKTTTTTTTTTTTNQKTKNTQNQNQNHDQL